MELDWDKIKTLFAEFVWLNIDVDDHIATCVYCLKNNANNAFGQGTRIASQEQLLRHKNLITHKKSERDWLRTRRDLHFYGYSRDTL